jgi:hypothetical protein
MKRHSDDNDFMENVFERFKYIGVGWHIFAACNSWLMKSRTTMVCAGSLCFYNDKLSI